jgi:hypothetical protein
MSVCFKNVGKHFLITAAVVLGVGCRSERRAILEDGWLMELCL